MMCAASCRGDAGTVSRFASRLLASPDIYGHQEREPEQSINFVTCHDGFTLNDLVSYNRKHNEANGEENRDGMRRQPELELRGRRAHRRPRHRVASQPPGKEFSGRDPPVSRGAHAPHGGRGAADPGGQQQRLLPGQRDQLVRLGLAGAACRCPPFRPSVDCRTAQARHRGGGPRPDPQPAPPPGTAGVARDQAGTARLGR